MPPRQRCYSGAATAQQISDWYTFSHIIHGALFYGATSATIARGYYGDSVLNSMCDVLACVLGFALASRFRWWWTLSWIVAMELFVAAFIRDNLTLNIIMLIWPIEAIRRWQMGA